MSTSHVLEHSVNTDTPADAILDRLLTPSNWPQWQPEIVSIRGPDRLSAGDVVSGHATMLGFRVAGTSTAVEVDRSAFEQDVVVGVRMRVHYRVSPRADGSGAVVVHRITTEMPGGTLGRFLAFFLKRRLKKMQRTAVTRLVQPADASDP